MRRVQYNVGLLVGRAFALAHQDVGAEEARAAAELCDLANGDRLALVLAQARFEEFLARPSGTETDRCALRMLDEALELFDEKHSLAAA